MAYTRQRPILTQRNAPSTSNNRSALIGYRNRFCILLSVTILYTAFLRRSGGARSFLSTQTSPKSMQIATWNIAAINNNPFEYWITYKENPDYENLMVDIEKFIETPGDKDVQVTQVFTPDMFEALDKRLVDTAGWTSMRKYWEDDFSKRKIIENFMKDPTLGNKRLASMPDRITNTINTAQEGKSVFRPTVINMYEGDLSTQAKWWDAWQKFMFDTKVSIKDKDGSIVDKIPYQMLLPITKTKYPEITAQEESDSLPLQTLCGAIFDAILVHMMNTVSQPDVWQPLKKVIVDSLNKQKIPHTLAILNDQYSTSDIITLQEVSSSFIDKARQGSLGKLFHIIAPESLDPVRDQNSVICLNKKTFPTGKVEELTEKVKIKVKEQYPPDAKLPIADGDILAITTKTVSGVPLVVASFHGDTNGLATKPVVTAVVQAMKADSSLQDHQLIFGLDANTYEHAKPGKQQDVLEFADSYVELGLTSCWGDKPNPSNYTTYNARTFLQPQLNKACRQTEKRSNGDVNPKDFILFPKTAFGVVKTWKDNTGRKQYVEDMAFPTLNFPSDHGILATIIEPLK